MAIYVKTGLWYTLKFEHRMLTEIITSSEGPNLLFKLFNKVLEQRVVKVFSTEQCVSVCRLHFKHALLNLQDGNVESPTTKVIHCNSTINNRQYYASNEAKRCSRFSDSARCMSEMKPSLGNSSQMWKLESKACWITNPKAGFNKHSWRLLAGFLMVIIGYSKSPPTSMHRKNLLEIVWVIFYRLVR